MEKIIFTFILISCYSVVYGQFKLSLIYQQDQYKQNYEQLTTFAGGTAEPALDFHKGNTTQVQAMWTFTPYLSVFAGLGYNSKVFTPHLSFPLFGLLTPDGGFLSDPMLRTQHFSNIEIPLGFRFNIPEYQNFEIGLSAAIVTAIAIKETEVYQSGFLPFDEFQSNGVPFYEKTWSHYGNRLDLGLDVQYNINKYWAVLVAYSWSPYDFRTLNLMNEATLNFSFLISNNALLKSGQKSVRFGIMHSF